MRVVFFATSEFATDCLKAVNQTEEIVAVITQVDKPKGRGLKLSSPAIKELVLELGLRLFQPINLIDILDELRNSSIDLIVVCAYGKIIPKYIIDLPKFAICVHPSLLPKYRGASPINYVIMNGETKTGVTTFFLTEKLDAGDIILQQEVPIEYDDNYQTLHNKLRLVAAEVLLQTIDNLKNNNYDRIRQNEEEATYAPAIKTEDTRINFDNTAKNIYNFIRGLTPYPGCFTYYNKKLLKIHKVKIYDEDKDYEDTGKVLHVDKKLGIIVSTRKGSIILEELQPEGKNKMRAIDFVNGYRVRVGDKFW